MSAFVQRYRNAKTAIAQIRNGEWIPKYNLCSLEHLTAARGGLELWIGNGAFFCEIGEGANRYFGLLWRHWVWWAAARRFKKLADNKSGPGAPVLV